MHDYRIGMIELSSPSGIPSCEAVDLSILVVSYNCAQDVKLCLESVQRHVRGLRWEFLVRDNASSDVQELLELHHDRVKIFAGTDNPGFGIANNQIAKMAIGQFLLCLNPDTELLNDTPSILVAHMREHAECGAAGPALRNSDSSPQVSWARPSGLWWDFCEAHYLQGWYRRRAETWRLKQFPMTFARIGFVSGACVCFRKADFLRLGGFDPGFFLNHEDIDLCDRVRASGFEVHFLPDISVLHKDGGTQKRDWRRFVFHRLQGKWVYIDRRYRGLAKLAARVIWWEAVCLRLLVGFFTLRGTDRTRLPGYLTAAAWAWNGRPTDHR